MNSRLNTRTELPSSKIGNGVVAKDGTRLFVREWGTGTPVIFTHSLGLSSEMWHRQMLHLATRGCRCIAYDRRGHGRSDVPPFGYDLDTLADDLASVVEAVGSGAVTLVGHSMGAGEIIRYLARHGTGRVSRIAFVAPTTPNLSASGDTPEGIRESDLEALDRAWTNDFPSWVEQNKRPFFALDTSEETMDYFVRLMLATPLTVLLACNQSMVEADHRLALRGIDKPVLILHGDMDMSAPLQQTGVPTQKGIPAARLIVYPGAPHGLFITHADRVNSDLEGFVVDGLSQ